MIPWCELAFFWSSQHVFHTSFDKCFCVIIVALPDLVGDTSFVPTVIVIVDACACSFFFIGYHSHKVSCEGVSLMR